MIIEKYKPKYHHNQYNCLKKCAKILAKNDKALTEIANRYLEIDKKISKEVIAKNFHYDNPERYKLIREMLKGCEHDGSYIPVSEVERLMNKAIEEGRRIENSDWNNDVMPMVIEQERERILKIIEKKQKDNSDYLNRALKMTVENEYYKESLIKVWKAIIDYTKGLLTEVRK
jgi:hypothetical protein